MAKRHKPDETLRSCGSLKWWPARQVRWPSIRSIDVTDVTYCSPGVIGPAMATARRSPAGQH